MSGQITATEAAEIAHRWVDGNAPGAEAVLHEFARGWVIAARFPAGKIRPDITSVVLDRRTGALVTGGSLPPPAIANWYMSLPDTPAEPARRDKSGTMTRLTVDGGIWLARSAQEDVPAPLHPAIAAFYRTLPAEYAERGCERVSEAVALSEALRNEDARRDREGLPPLTRDEIRDYLRDARLATFRAWDWDGATDGESVRPSIPTLLLLDFLGVDLASALPPPPDLP